MANPLQAFSNKYLKVPDCWRSLLWLGGFLLVDKMFLDHYVQRYIFGDDGQGGEVLLMKTRTTHHEHEFREERKKYYWHQRYARFYIPSSFNLNTKLDYQTLSYNYSHLGTVAIPSEVPKNHHPETNTFSKVTTDYFYKE